MNEKRVKILWIKIAFQMEDGLIEWKWSTCVYKKTQTSDNASQLEWNIVRARLLNSETKCRCKNEKKFNVNKTVVRCVYVEWNLKMNEHIQFNIIKNKIILPIQCRRKTKYLCKNRTQWRKSKTHTHISLSIDNHHFINRRTRTRILFA